MFLGIALAGRAVTIQAGREAALEPGTVVHSDTSRPFLTHVEKSSDIVWLSVPKAVVTDRLRGVEDDVARTLRPARPITRIATELLNGFDAALAVDPPAHDAERLTAQFLDMMALAILGGSLPAGAPRPTTVTDLH